MFIRDPVCAVHGEKGNKNDESVVHEIKMTCQGM